MKKILFLLLLTVTAYGQTYQNPTFGTVKTMTAPTVTATPHLGTVETNGTISKITPANLPVSTATQTAIDLKANKDSGLLLGGGLSINADPTKYDLATGEGYVTNSLTGVVHPISWGTQSALTTPYRTTSVATYVLMADAGGGFGTIVTQNTAPTPQQYRTHIYLGKLAHTTFTNILFAVSEPSRMFDLAGQVSDVNLTLGARNISGNVITYNGTNLNINASAGQMYRAGANYLNDRNSPSITTESAFTAGTFRNKFRNGSGGWTAVNTSVIDPNFYDDGTGILAAVPNNKWTIKVFWRFGGTGTIHCDYGQAIYDNKADAILAIDKAITAEDPENVRDAAKRGWLVVKKGATALNVLTDAEFFKAGKDGERIAGGSSTATEQVVYDNSVTPHIVTSPEGGAFTIKNGTASDSNNIFQGQNIAGSNTFSVTGAGNITGGTYNGYVPESNSNKATDFSTVNNTLYPTVQAAKTYADGLVVGLLNDRGSYDASSNLYPSTGGSGTAGAIKKGNIWAISVAGTLGGVSVGIGDWVRALVDTPGQTSSNWSVVEGNFGYVPANDANTMHLSGSESFTGVKTSTNTGSSQINGISLTNNGTIGSYSYKATTTSSGRGYSATNSGTADSYYSDITGSGSGFTSNASPTGSGLLFDGRNDGTTTFSVNKTGVVAGTSFVKSGATSGNILLASGSDIPQSTFQTALTNPITGSLTSGYLPISTGANNLGNSIVSDNGTNIILNRSDSRFIGGDTLGRLIVGNSDITSYVTFYGSSHSTSPYKIDFISNATIPLSLSSSGATLTGAPTAPTATAGSTGTQIANLDFVNTAVASPPNAVLLTGNQTVSGVKSFITGIGATPMAGLLNSFTTTTEPAIGKSASGYFSFRNSGGVYTNFASIDTAALTSSRTYSLPNQGGYLAITQNSTGAVRYVGYTVATLPAGTQGDTAYVTDATAPTYLGTLTGGGSVVCPVFYNGTAWVAH